MLKSITQFLSPPIFNSYEQTQKAKFLHATLFAAIFAGLAIGWVNLKLDAVLLASSLFTLAGTSLLGLYLNHRKHFHAAAYLLSFMALSIMNFNLIDGDALQDPGVAAYPIFIIFTSILFGKRSILVSTPLAIGSIASVYLLGIFELVEVESPPTLNRVQILSILFVITALLLWAITDIWEKTLINLRETYDLTLEGWAKALEYKDQETEGHSRRVTDMCAALARGLGCSEEEIIHIRRGALLHDIGKIAIPDHILFKPGPLDDAEWEIMKRHPVFAMDMLSNIPFLKPALSIPYCHHERWDGEGYPLGLKGEQIPLPARIFTVIDNWEALNSDRPYRQAWPEDVIIEYLKENSGKIFDPHILEVFLRMLETFQFQ